MVVSLVETGNGRKRLENSTYPKKRFGVDLVRSGKGLIESDR